MSENDSEKQRIDVRDIDPDRHCTFSKIRKNEEGKPKMWFCKKPSEYRVLISSGRSVLDENDKWVSELRNDYVCFEHFNERYRNNDVDFPADGSWTFRKIKRKKEGE